MGVYAYAISDIAPICGEREGKYISIFESPEAFHYAYRSPYQVCLLLFLVSNHDQIDLVMEFIFLDFFPCRFW